METVRIHDLSGISSVLQAILKNGQMEAANVWNQCRDIHLEARTHHTRWPKRKELQLATKGAYELHSQSVQMVCHAFLANIDAAKANRKLNPKIRYPYKDKLFYPLLWPAQAVGVQGGYLVLPMGRGRKSVAIKRPKWFPEQGAACKVIWNGVHYELHVTITVEPIKPIMSEVVATVDLGQIHLAAVTTNTDQAMITTGRGIRSEKRRLTKTNGELQRKIQRCTKGSRRWRKLTGAKRKASLRSKRRIRNMRHQSTRQVVSFLQANSVSSIYVGNPHGVRNKNCGRHHNQRMSQWEYGKDIDYLAHKTEQAGIACSTGTERGTSSQCPQCGHRHKPKGRNWTCKKCDFSGHRDLVGSANMHVLGFGKSVVFPSLRETTYLRPGQGSPWRVQALEDPCAGSSSRPDTGQAFGPVVDEAVEVNRPDRRGTSVHEPLQRISSETHTL